MNNSYQRRKARMIAAVLISAAAASGTALSELPAITAAMSHREWISVSLAAGVPVANDSAKVLTVAYLLKVGA